MGIDSSKSVKESIKSMGIWLLSHQALHFVVECLTTRSREISKLWVMWSVYSIALKFEDCLGRGMVLIYATFQNDTVNSTPNHVKISNNLTIHRLMAQWKIMTLTIKASGIRWFAVLLWVESTNTLLAEWRSGSVPALPCERPGFAPRTRLREIIPANNCTMQGQNNWGNWGSPGVMKLWVAWEVLRWLMKFRELCSGGFHPKLVSPPNHGFLNVNTPPNSQN